MHDTDREMDILHHRQKGNMLDLLEEFEMYDPQEPGHRKSNSKQPTTS